MKNFLRWLLKFCICLVYVGIIFMVLGDFTLMLFWGEEMSALFLITYGTVLFLLMIITFYLLTGYQLTKEKPQKCFYFIFVALLIVRFLLTLTPTMNRISEIDGCYDDGNTWNKKKGACVEGPKGEESSLTQPPLNQPILEKVE